MFDKIFKLLILLIIVGFLTIFYLSMNDNRYSIQWGKDDASVSVFDSKTGKLYIKTGKEGWVMHDPIKKAYTLITNDPLGIRERPPLDSFWKK